MEVATGIITIIDFSAKILLTCYRIREQVKSFESDVSAIIAEVETLSDITEELKDVFGVDDGKQAVVPDQARSHGESTLATYQKALKGCVDVLKDLSDQLEPLSKPRLRHKLKWPFESSAVYQKLDVIQKHKATLQLALTVYQTRASKDRSSKVEDIYFRNKKAEVLKWYKTSDPERNHRISREHHQPTTGAWIFEHDAFKEWKASEGGQILWLHGIPGAGKTILCSTVINHMQSDRELGAPVVYFYFDFQDSKKQTFAGLLKSAIFQLIADAKDESDLQSAQELYESKHAGLNDPTTQELLDVFWGAIATMKRTYLIVDALDECPKEERRMFMDELLESASSSNLNVLITSREEADIVKGLKPRATSVLRLEAVLVDEDVKTHVQHVIQTEPLLKLMRPKLQNEIQEKIVSGASGMFRWAICQLDRIKQCLTPAMVREELSSMPATLDETYDRILHSVPSSQQHFVQSALHWLCFSARPLLLGELAEASCIRPETGVFDPETCRLFNDSMIMDLCGVLVTSTKLDRYATQVDWIHVKIETEARGSRSFTRKGSYTVVSLSHYSVKEYITSSRLLQHASLSGHYSSMSLGNSFLGQCCLLYLLDFNQGKVASELDFGAFPRLEYSARYWINHWKEGRGREENDQPLHLLYDRLFDRDDRVAFINWLNIWEPDQQISVRQYRPRSAYLNKSADLFPQHLYWAAFLGDTTRVKSLIEEGAADLNATEGYFGSALGAAAYNGHLEVITHLIEAGANVNARGTRSGTVLQMACVGGHEAIVQSLVEAGADINAMGGEACGTALIAAASHQNSEIMTLLIRNGALVDVDMEKKGSALYTAATTGDVKLVKILLEAGADINGATGTNAPSALQGAVSSGSLSLVNLLIRKGADVNIGKQDTELYLDFRAEPYPLHEAARRGHSHIVRTLLAAGADATLRGRRGTTVLEQAINSRDMTTFNIILDITTDLNSCSHLHENCFHMAVRYSDLDMARKLRDRGADLGQEVLINAVGKYHEHPWILEDLFERGVDVNLFSRKSGLGLTTALHVAAAEKGGRCYEVVKLLLEKGAYVDPVSFGYNTTPLCIALENGNAKIAKLLIAHGADVRRTINYSPFEMAVRAACDDGGTLDMAELLLDYYYADDNTDADYALYWPLTRKKPSVLRWLVDNGASLDRHLVPKGRVFEVSFYERGSFTPIQYAAKKGNVDQMKLLLELGADINGPPGVQGTTLHYGLLSGNKDIVRFLLDKGATVDHTPNLSALFKAVDKGLDEMVQTLIEHGADITATERGKSPLAAAYAAGKGDLMKLLWDKGARFAEEDGNMVICAMEKEDYLEQMRLLVGDYGFDPATKTSVGHMSSIIGTAMHKTDTNAIQLLLDLGVSLSGQAMQSGFDRVCSTGHVEMITFLLENGAEIDVTKALYEAASVPNNLAVVDLLLLHGADVAADDGQSVSAATRAKCRKTLSRLLEQPMTAEKRAEYLNKALQIAACDADLSLCEWLLDDQGADINRCGLPYGSPLQAALSQKMGLGSNHIPTAKTLLDRGADVNPPPTVRKPSRLDASTTIAPPLSFALAGSSSTTDVKHFAVDLLSRGADINGIGGMYHTPLQAVASQYPSMVSLLLDAGAEVNVVGGKHGTALHAAAWNKDVETVRLLLAHGADPLISCEPIGSVLRAAARGYRYERKLGRLTVEIMDLLYEAGADIHETSGELGSAVQMAANTGNLDALKWLAAKGVDIRVKGGVYGNAYRAAMNNFKTHQFVEWEVVSWLEQHYGRDGWEVDEQDQVQEDARHA